MPVMVAAVAILSTGGRMSKPTAFVIPSDVTNCRWGLNPRRSCALVEHSTTKAPTSLFVGKSDNDENADLLERARRLREEANLMEDDLRATTGDRASAASLSTENTPKANIVNKQLEESIWTLSYRFSSQPASEADDKSSSTNNYSESPLSSTKFYSGKLKLLLKKDGYSEQIVGKGNERNNEKDIEIVKVWGWDRETSNEDNLDYLLFSMDVRFPVSDPDLANQKERYYFQARIEEDTGTTEGISLKEGTITVKKDVTEKTGGMWGLFNVAGILTQFRYCGDFVAKATR